MKFRLLQSTLTCTIAFYILISCSSSKSTSTNFFKKNVQASYYADKFNGRKTANGETFNNSKLTCAHKKLPFGTKLKVTNIVNNISVEVRVNDRGPQKQDRELDLSKTAFMKITDSKNKGILLVNIQVIN
jgi:rare lipoprotein A